MTTSTSAAALLLLVVLLVPAAAAQESETKPYPFVGKDGVGHSTTFYASCRGCYTEFTVVVVDALSAATWFSICVPTDHQDGRGEDEHCGDGPDGPDDIEDPRAEGCGVATLSTPVPMGGPSDPVHVTLRPVHVDQATGHVCLATAGTVTVTFS